MGGSLNMHDLQNLTKFIPSLIDQKQILALSDSLRILRDDWDPDSFIDTRQGQFYPCGQKNSDEIYFFGRLLFFCT